MSYREGLNKFIESVDDNLLGIDEVEVLADLQNGLSGDLDSKRKQAIQIRLEQLDKERFDINKQIKRANALGEKNGSR